MSYVAGYVMVNDITARDLVRRTDVPAMGTDWLQSKNGPGFLPMGPYLVPAAFLPDPYGVKMTLSLNERPMQSSMVADMMFDIATQIEYLSQYVQLLPGDVSVGHPGGLWHTLQALSTAWRCHPRQNAGARQPTHPLRGRVSPRRNQPWRSFNATIACAKASGLIGLDRCSS